MFRLSKSHSNWVIFTLIDNVRIIVTYMVAIPCVRCTWGWLCGVVCAGVGFFLGGGDPAASDRPNHIIRGPQVQSIQMGVQSIQRCTVQLHECKGVVLGPLRWTIKWVPLRVHTRCYVQLVDSQVSLANAFGCFPLNTIINVRRPSKYLGLPLYLGLPKKQLWDSLVERIDKRLSSWKSRYLCMGGRLTLIKSVLSGIPVYY